MRNKRQTGNAYEELAAAYLEKEGCRILERNYRIRTGEIDLIVRDGRYLVFIEVKYRRSSLCGTALEAVDRHKQRQICRTALYYCKKKGYSLDTPCRFDVIAVENGQIRRLTNAFPFIL